MTHQQHAKKLSEVIYTGFIFTFFFERMDPVSKNNPLVTPIGTTNTPSTPLKVDQ